MKSLHFLKTWNSTKKYKCRGENLLFQEALSNLLQLKRCFRNTAFHLVIVIINAELELSQIRHRVIIIYNLLPKPWE